MEIDIEYSPAFAATYAASRAYRPLIQLAPGVLEPRITLEDDALPGLIRLAMKKTIDADDDLYGRLPVPVRYRAAGAIDAWRHVRDAAGRSGADFSQRLQLHAMGPLMHNFPLYLESWAVDCPSCIDDPDDMGHAQRSVIWQAFSACKGALYEPTPALHRLLDAAYIADDVPVKMIRLPVDTMCIIPSPDWRGRKDGIEAITLFHRRRDADDVRHEVISCLTWRQYGPQDDRRTRLELLELSLAEPDKTIKRMFDDSPENSTGNSAPRSYWEGVLDYVIKMLLYLTVRDAHVEHDRAYTDAPRQFSGLGKRKRAQRLAEIERLYDRYVVGPAILDMEAAASLPTDGAQREVRGHWRRPHFKMQPHGPNASLRKLVFIGPTIVRPDRLGL